MGNERGQSLIEFVALIPVITLVIVGTGWLLRESFRRTECSRLVFEGVRRRLEGGSATRFRLMGVELRTIEDGVEGKLKCGNHTETLFLPKLDLRKPGASRFHSSF